MISNNNNIVMLNNVTKIYNTHEHKTAGVQSVNLQAKKGEMLLILGPSGSGKTTLLTLIAGLIKPSEGTVNVFGKNIGDYSRLEIQKMRAEKIGFVFQSFLLIESLSVIENILLVQNFIKKEKKLAYKKSLQLLQQFGIDHLASESPINLSQGEKQRTALARAIANDTELILADEPTASLESEQGFKIIRLLHQFAKEESKCVIVVSHDLRLKEFADRILWLENGAFQNQL